MEILRPQKKKETLGGGCMNSVNSIGLSCEEISQEKIAKLIEIGFLF
jgi:hypothetical protein